jgi:hypothetical protein
VGSSSWLDLNVRGRTLFAGLYLATWQHSSSSPLRRTAFPDVQRVVDHRDTAARARAERVVVPTAGGSATRTEGAAVPVNDHPGSDSANLDQHAAYGVDAQLFRLQKALDTLRPRMRRRTR